MGGWIPAALLCLQSRCPLPWDMFLLLIGFQLLVIHSWTSQELRKNDDQKVMGSYFPATVEYAIHIFNLKSKETNAYKLVRILNSWKEQVETMMAFSMKLEIRRTKCGKFDDDIDNCPFQQSPELNNTFTCFFTISTNPWRTMFKLLNKTCLEGFF